MNDLMTPAQLALKYKIVSRSLLYTACQGGLIPHYRLRAKKGTRGKYAIRETDFLAWLERNKYENVSPKDESMKYL